MFRGIICGCCPVSELELMEKIEELTTTFAQVTTTMEANTCTSSVVYPSLLVVMDELQCVADDLPSIQAMKKAMSTEVITRFYSPQGNYQYVC